MRRYEYTVVVTKSYMHPESILNEFGADGWILRSVVYHPSLGEREMYLCRPVDEASKDKAVPFGPGKT